MGRGGRRGDRETRDGSAETGRAARRRGEAETEDAERGYFFADAAAQVEVPEHAGGDSAPGAPGFADGR